MYSIVGVGVKVLESSSGYLDAVCDSHNFYQMAAQIFGTDFVDEVHEFRKAETARCSPRNPSLNLLVEEMREGRVSQEPKRERAANSIKLLVYKKCPIKSPETATKIGQNCLKLHEITKVKKIAKIATRNLTQFHPISFNFTQFCSIF